MIIKKILLTALSLVKICDLSAMKRPITYAEESLRYSIGYNTEGYLKHLLENTSNLDLNYYFIDGLAPIHVAINNYIAIWSIDLNIVKLLLQHGANINLLTNDQNKISPLHIAINKNHFGLIKFLMDKGASINTKDNKEQDALHYACNNLNVIKILLHKGANINSQDIEGNTVLHKTTSTEVINYLLNFADLDINKKNKKHLTALKHTYIKYYYDVNQFRDDINLKHKLDILFQYYLDLFLKAAKANSISKIRKFIIDNLFFAKHYRDKTRNNILHLACKTGNQDFISAVLIEVPGLVNRKNKNLEMPILIAVSQGPKALAPFFTAVK